MIGASSTDEIDPELDPNLSTAAVGRLGTYQNRLQRSLCYPQLLYSSTSGPTTDDVRFPELRKITLPDQSRAVFSVPLALQ
jgi:hypothetical protein